MIGIYGRYHAVKYGILVKNNPIDITVPLGTTSILTYPYFENFS